MFVKLQNVCKITNYSVSIFHIILNYYFCCIYTIKMINNNYIPKPIDTSDVTIPEGLDTLIEQLARNVHEVWAYGRISEGWTYGPELNGDLKQHPCLVDYDDLPDSEKEYDRRTAIGTLCMILKFGWTLEKHDR